MKMKAGLIALLIVISSFIVLKHNSVCGQTENEKSHATKEPIATEEVNTLDTLTGVVQLITELRKEIESEEKKYHEAQIQEDRTEIKEEIDKLNERLESLKTNFEEIATGLDLETFYQKPQKRFDWKEEIQTLVGPIVNDLKNMTARPRLIENLRTQTAYYEKQISLVKNALKNIHAIAAQVKDEALKEQLIDLENTWNSKGRQISSQLTIAKYQLADKLSERKTLLESGKNIVRVFFKSRGRNFILSVFAFLFVFFLLRYVHSHIYKGSFIHKTVANSFYIRLAEVLYYVFTFVGATGALLIVLYLCGDWVLLGIAFIFILGLIWTAKQTLPRFYEQGTLLLNLGTVKENERVLYNGLPWKVVSLQLNTQLVNPELKGGRIRIPIRDLKDMRSRPYHPDEPWFPCKENDWVVLADGTFGKVVTQTPEVVQLIVGGGSHKTYLTTEFLKQTPLNLSRSFSVRITYGIDYRHQAIAITEVPSKLKEAVNAGLINEGYRNDLLNLNVEFKEAADSSLDYLVSAEFSGRIAGDYYKLSRIMQKVALETCNKYGWEIPFTTYTVHTVPSNDLAPRLNPRSA
ncbi:MAG: hypothetical protein AYP45_14820 [Candidatus Brocadia carolinensis]|uniref:Uncharacterized protein n=1 Tax=Candidatus Brocadia carolinensis TaxID=1004156 RepID=A0A1V4AQL6_9BACT|nr:MAG: hypothetical protein AYP45_14820 [Candidatus Brocadia caroliniensis]